MCVLVSNDVTLQPDFSPLSSRTAGTRAGWALGGAGGDTGAGAGRGRWTEWTERCVAGGEAS